MTALPTVEIAMVRSAICDEVARNAALKYGDSLIAIILTGSLARDEATLIEDNHTFKILGDADFLLVFRNRRSLPSDPEIRALQQTIGGALRQSCIECHIGLSPVLPTYLSSLPPRIFTYELRSCGLVIWGNSEILSLIPAWRPADLSLEDAWRLLCNRMVEFLEAAHEVPTGNLHYRAVKLYLDIATSFLITQGHYAPTYQQRAERLRMLADGGNIAEPFKLSTFSELVSFCTEVKLGRYALALPYSQQMYSTDKPLWQHAIQDARALWRFQLLRLTSARQDMPDHELIRCWMSGQPWLARLRGWLSVIRHSGWLRSWKEWLRWLRWAHVASPRYLLYAAAAEVLFELPILTDYCADSSDRQGRLNLLRALPIRHRPVDASGWSAWRLAAHEIAFNYHEFLEKTRA